MDTLSTALRWHGLGIATIPILQNSKRPGLQSWREFQTVLPRESQLRAWFSQPEYSIAVITGWRGLVVVDWDNMDKFDEWQYGFSSQGLMEWIIRNTYCVDTPRGGSHYYFYCARPTKCLPFNGGDVKSQGGYVLTPPSQGYLMVSRTSQIQFIDSIEALYLPGYTAAMQPKPRPAYDPFEDAMRPWTPGNGMAVAEIKRAWTLDRVLGTINSKLGRAWQTSCPLPGHADNNPSFVIYPDGHWHCYGCGQHGGDVIDLYAALNGLSNSEAIAEMGRI